MTKPHTSPQPSDGMASILKVAAKMDQELSELPMPSHAAIVNILSVNALAPLPLIIPAYSVSKAAAFSLTQSLRALLAGQGVRVHAVLPGRARWTPI